jgi:hypothetical protein
MVARMNTQLFDALPAMLDEEASDRDVHITGLSVEAWVGALCCSCPWTAEKIARLPSLCILFKLIARMAFLSCPKMPGQT